MMRMITKTTGLSPTYGGSGGGGEWELRPGGMLVQKRTDSDQNRVPPPTIRVRVKYGSNYHEVHISSQATFGELKKMLSGQTGLHHQDQKLLFNNKERDSKAFLDISGVKDRSKIVLLEDPISKEKRYIEMQKSAKMEKASKTISEISLEVDRLAGQVSALESVISKGAKVAEKDVLNLIELLMNQLLKLDGIIADGDVKLQRKMQVRRVQKYVETLDVLKIKNSTSTSNGSQIPQQQLPSQQQMYSNGKIASPNQQEQARHSVGHLPIHTEAQPQQSSRHSTSGAVVITTQWETFDSVPAMLPATPSTTTIASTTITSGQQKFSWDLL
ncbi:BAG family molecular chaperone regulator 3-like [Actinidia eriantha]|uniref:BAG family molecular chaperone regulator 3-like n=1 Tax=Actinidia eriantha TaxID=165200 RepID=UPI0025890E57|nr:BAG family molecular chaperone regulator 3-like [Actinidia eriantha]XP_057478932.1 BAG family molecular chaperone regulator 3-like [Actinidia eriantha]